MRLAQPFDNPVELAFLLAEMLNEELKERRAAA